MIELCLVAIGLALFGGGFNSFRSELVKCGNLKTVVELGYGVKDYVMVLVGWRGNVDSVGVFVAGVDGSGL